MAHPTEVRWSLMDRVVRRLRSQVAEPLARNVGAPIRRWRNAGREYRPIFVGGASGSGTSLLALTIGQVFDCAGVIYESNLQVSERSVLYVPDIEMFPTVADYQRAIGPHDAWSIEGARRDLLDLYRSYTSGPSDVVIDKGPDTNLLRAGFLARCFPDASFVLVFRDPVANVEGLRRKWSTFANDSLAESIRFYTEIHERFLRGVEACSERVVAVEYETLVEHYDATTARIGERLGLAPATKRRGLWPVANVEGEGIRNVRGNRIRVVKDANQRAYERLGQEPVDEIRTALGPLHERLRALPFGV